MNRLFATAVLLFAVMSLRAADEAKPNTLTPKEISDGWLLLFDGETTFGWKAEGDVKVADGALKVGGTKAGNLTTTSKFTFCSVSFEFLLDGKDPKGASFLLDGKHPLVEAKKWHSASFTITPMSFDSLLGELGSKEKVATALKGPQAAKLADVGFAVPADTTLTLRNIKLKPLELKPIFNGKDLTGWKEHPGKKSKWSVADGKIDLKDGPGDLQTETQWADFILQIECISNGKHLNSGVFFRCLPDQYQQGYEAQIHNGFLPEATKEYSIDEYNPETNKLVASKKVKYTAIDYGTGAIYRRIPARKQVAKDNEWFTMTVLAEGRHIATWVNGYQVVDWTDNRPVNANARNGCKLEKGNVSLQGHDPTTDLSFRNIRVAELPAR